MKLRAALAAFAAAGLLASCGSSDTPGVGGGPASSVRQAPPGALHGDLPASFAASGSLRVAVDVDRAPLMFQATGTTQTEGIESELITAMSRQLGVQLKVEPMTLTQLGPAVLQGKADAFVGGFVDLKAFEGAGLDFVDDLNGYSQVVVADANPAKIQAPTDLCGHTVGYLGGTAQQIALQDLAGSCSAKHRTAPRPVAQTSHAAMLQLLTTGKVDAVIDDAVIGEYAAQESTASSVVSAVGSPFDPMPYGIGVARAQQPLRDALQSALLAVVRDGEYDAILEKWGGGSYALHNAPIDGGR